jgi:alkylation response protein AidB-like acyl-CoA dehydrogenase
MDFNFSKEQGILKESAHRFFEKECPKQLVRELFDDERGYSPELWSKMADLGWLGVNFPNAYGGSGSNFIDLVLLQEEMGRALMPSPFVTTVVIGGEVVLDAGNEEQKQYFLPGIATGEIIISLALLEPGGSLNPSSINVSAKPAGEAFIIDGIKLFVPYAHVADYLLCVTRTLGRQGQDDGITLFLVDANSKGIHKKLLKTITGEKLCEVTFDNVSVPKSSTIGELNHGWSVMERRLAEAAIAECGWMVGGARWILDTAVAYAKERIQFGVPIGSFQAIQHKFSDMLIDVDGAAFITYYAAWLTSEDDPEKIMAASKAKCWCSDMYHRTAGEGIQILGGIGFTLEHDMQLYFRRARASEVAFGDSHYHREKLARSFGL